MRITARIIPKSIAVPAGVRKQAVPQIVRELGLFEHVERFQEAQFPSITRAEIIRGTEPLTNAAKVAAREAQGEALEHAAPGLQLRKLHPRNSLYYWVFLE
ncbi:MAG: hypothetical protein LBP35_06900 [Candidatus Ancillula trichonymphae]|jgi:hypothetical protein|nr:hypothetical protein [Candidatus Ancillula trichonymphae]